MAVEQRFDHVAADGFDHEEQGVAPSAAVIVEINGTQSAFAQLRRGEQGASLQFEIDLLHGHKTGFYLDQRDNYAVVGEHAAGRWVLDCF